MGARILGPPQDLEVIEHAFGLDFYGIGDALGGEALVPKDSNGFTGEADAAWHCVGSVASGAGFMGARGER
ncbi:MAG: hypothetical protein ACK5VE_01565 [Alphaproteobacteria bacterium]|jgi:hypothetical protein